MTDAGETFTIETLDTQFKAISEQVGGLSKATRGVQDSLKSLQRSFRALDKQSRKSKKRPQAKLNMSNELENFLSVDHGTQMTKAEVMKSISNYIKEKDLQIATDRRKFVPNKELSKIFGMKKSQNLTFVEINKMISPHLSK